MDQLNRILERVVGRVNINLAEMSFDVQPYIAGLVPPEKFSQFYAFYGLSDRLPLHFRFTGSSLAGSYFLGKCVVSDSALYKADVRGDELKRAGDSLAHGSLSVPVHRDEQISISYSFLHKTLVHNFSHDPEEPENFYIHNTAAMPCSNIHGSPVKGTFLGAFATIDLTTVQGCVIGEFAYVQAREIAHHFVKPGEIWINSAGSFNFRYQYDPEILARYVSHRAGELPTGIIWDFVERHKAFFRPVYDNLSLQGSCLLGVGAGSSVSPYCVVKGDYKLGDNILVAQRAYVEDSYLDTGANVQENCYVINSRLGGLNVTAHGGKIINANLGRKTFVGFNSFLRGGPGRTLEIGAGSIVMPHTIIDVDQPLQIRPDTLVWGYIGSPADLADHSISLDEMAKNGGEAINLGNMSFTGDGGAFVDAFKHRIDHILEANGAFWDGTDQTAGHAQKGQSLSFNTVQPYNEGELQGVWPTIDIRP